MSTLQDYLESLAFNAVLTAVKLSVKNPEKKVSLKKVMLKIFNAIKALYADDSDFE